MRVGFWLRLGKFEREFLAKVRGKIKVVVFKFVVRWSLGLWIWDLGVEDFINLV